ncbi:MAG: hydantoinase/oxoprolinase family protein, partial [Pseudomonadota bacterium]
MKSTERGQIVGVDVGGTFTDLILLNPATGAVSLAKVPSTQDNQAFGVMNALSEAETNLGSVGLIVHGTTTTTNAVLERKLAKTGLITTEGFRDVLELGRRTRPQPYGMSGQFEPVIPRNLRLEVAERLDAAGRIVRELDENAVESAARHLLAAGCEAVVIHFLHAYANGAHEKRAGEIVRSVWPNEYITLGHGVISESREFERGVTAAVNASVQPILERYIARLSRELGDGGFDGSLLVMNGNGGMVSADLVSRQAANTVMSGPASGVVAAAYTGKKAGFESLITYDMGGTSTDVALIRDAQPSVSNEIEVEYAMPIHVPLVDVRTVGAGGGSIAKVNAAGLLEVGPESAGAMPGPICYGRGGTRPTISDANLVLGRLDPAKLHSVDASKAEVAVHEAFANQIGKALGLDAVEAAAAVLHLGNTIMAGAIRMVSISLGADPRDFALFAFGGAGPLHASALARELNVPTVLVPPRPGITNALGCVVADLRQDFVRTINQPLDAVDMDLVHTVFAEQTAKGERLLSAQAVEVEERRYLYSADMQFVGQTHLLRVALPDGEPDRDRLRTLFSEAYFDRFRVELPEMRANLVNLNCSVLGHRSDFDLSSLIDPTGRADRLGDAQTGERRVFFDDDWRPTPIYWR